MSIEDPNAFAEEWIAAWNSRDLDRILSHYAPDVTFVSPVAAKVTGHGVVQGTGPLRDYWSRALAMVPDLKFSLEGVLVGFECLSILYRNQRGQLVAEMCAFNADGKVERSVACYAA